MARIPLPERGQPLDVTFMSKIANAINDLSQQVSPAINKYISIDTQSAGKQNIKSSDARIIAGYKEVANNSTVQSGQEREFSYDFEGEFKYAPIVTATPLNVGGTPAGSDISIILKSVTTSRVTGIVKFRSNGDVSVAVNLVIIGVPN
jgi:hypothetical protein